MRQIVGVSTNRLLDVWEVLLSFSKYFLSNTLSQNIDNCCVAFSLLFSIYTIRSFKQNSAEHSLGKVNLFIGLYCLPCMIIIQMYMYAIVSTMT